MMADLKQLTFFLFRDPDIRREAYVGVLILMSRSRDCMTVKISRLYVGMISDLEYCNESLLKYISCELPHATSHTDTGLIN